MGSCKGNLPHKKGTKTSETACEDFPSDISRNICTTFSIQGFECLKCFHVNFTDLSEEKLKTLGNINGCFWACLHCRTQFLIPQDQSNINDEFFLTGLFFVQLTREKKVEALGGTLIAHKTNLCFSPATEFKTNFDFFYHVLFISCTFGRLIYRSGNFGQSIYSS